MREAAPSRLPPGGGPAPEEGCPAHTLALTWAGEPFLSQSFGMPFCAKVVLPAAFAQLADSLELRLFTKGAHALIARPFLSARIPNYFELIGGYVRRASLGAESGYRNYHKKNYKGLYHFGPSSNEPLHYTRSISVCRISHATKGRPVQRVSVRGQAEQPFRAQCLEHRRLRLQHWHAPALFPSVRHFR